MSTPSMEDEVLLAEGDASEALRSVEEIVAALREETGTTECSLRQGSAGLALGFRYLAALLGSDELARVADQHWEQAVATLTTRGGDLGLFDGATGVAWVTARLESLQRAEPDFDRHVEIEEALLDQLDVGQTEQEYNLLDGLVGAGVYAADRPASRRSRRILERIIEHLRATAVRHSGGLAWFTSPALRPPLVRARVPRGFFDLGLAHGNAGVVAFLSRFAVEFDPTPVEDLLTGAVRFLLAQESPLAGSPYRHASWLVDGDLRYGRRVAWCAGDLGVGLALLYAATAMNHPEWRARAHETLSRMAAVRGAVAGVLDHGLCHGTAGAGLCFQRACRVSGDPDLRDAARYWFARTLESRERGPDTVAGYGARRRVIAADGRDELVWAPDRGFLTGAMGVALALGSATSNAIDGWDRCLLLPTP